MSKEIQLQQAEVVAYWLYGLFITGAELIFTYWNVQVGILLHLFLFCLLVMETCVAYNDCSSRLYLSLTLVPLLRILSVSMPLAHLPIILWYLVISVPLFLVAVLVVQLNGFNYSELGFTFRNLPVQLLTALFGIPLGFGEYLILKPASLGLSLSLVEIWYSVIIFVICTGFLEEFIFRGILYRATLKIMGSKRTLFFVSLLNAVLYISNRSLWNFLYGFLLAMLFTKIYARQRSIIGLSLLHGVINITCYLLYPLILK